VDSTPLVHSRYVVFLRGISNVPMQPFRQALPDIGLDDVVSFGGTGNLIFSSDETDRARLEQRIEAAVGVDAFVRSRDELQAVVAGDPFLGRAGAAVLFMHAPPDQDRASSLLAGEFQRERPVISDSQVYFMHPLQRPGRRSIIDLERELGVRGTMRASRVVARVLTLM